MFYSIYYNIITLFFHISLDEDLKFKKKKLKLK